ncbi:MAG: beta-lactamase family protein [Anaeromyxobacter sp.]|nr:beta-lactamase family protein [Anaeromyxobacter sp.]MBL0277472.1 beta-lactamase family protein [Anaeromyxobacter sp.]
MAELAAVTQVLEQGRAEGVAAALSAVVARRGELVHQGWYGTLPAPGLRPLGPDDLFDVASLTKVLCTTTLATQAVAEGLLDLDAPAAGWLHGFEAEGKERVTVRQLLAHSSGLAWWRPWHQLVAGDPEAGVVFRPPAARPPFGALSGPFSVGRALVTSALLHEPLEAPPGTRAVYSDPGFMALGMVVERALGGRLPTLFQARVAHPLGLAATLFVDGLEPAATLARLAGRACAPTGFSEAREERLQGTVNDDNAWAMGGAAGHAGLFSTAADVAAIGQAWLDALAGRASVVPPEAALFAARDATPGSARALGWDTPSGEASSLGTRLGLGRRGGLGHLGFTGCSLWLDLDEELVAVLLTNHVHPVGVHKGRMLALRRRFHDAVAGGCGVG